MRADEQEEARNGSPKLQRAGLPVCTVPSLQVDDLNCDHRDPAQVLLYLRALRRELRAAFFPGAVSGAPRGEDAAAKESAPTPEQQRSG